MKKYYLLIILFLLFVSLITIIGSFFVSGDNPIVNADDIITIQSNKEVYFDMYGYDINNPNVIVNPYGNSPLTALVMFTSSDYSEVEVIIQSKDGNSDIRYKFGKDKYHMIPIYGLYADYENTVVVSCEGIDKVIDIKTDKLPEDFIYSENMIFDNFVFYNNNYPYIIDSNGEIRWYLNSNYYGNITNLDNSGFIIGSDRYNEDGNVISFYKMSFLGKIYNEYMIDNYYGMTALYNDNLLVLSSNVLLMDIQTGEVIKKYGNNDGYDYLGVYNNNIIVSKDDMFYSFNDGKLKEIDYNFGVNKIDFYLNTTNYNIVKSNRFGNLKETIVDEKEILLISYDNMDVLEDVTIVREVDRIKVVNNRENDIYLILDKFMDKRIYKISQIRYINMNGLDGKYTIYFKINDKIYKSNYYVEV